MAGVNWNCRYGFPGHQIANGGYGHGQELTVSPLEVISAFGMGLEAWSIAAGLWREKEQAVEVESEVFVTKMTNARYLRLREVAAKLGVTSASAIEVRARESYGGGCWKPRTGDGREGGALLGVL